MTHEKRNLSPFPLTLGVTLALACQATLAQEPPEAPEQPAAPSAPVVSDAAELEFKVHAQSRAEAVERYAEALRLAAEEQRAALEAVEMAQRELQVRAEEERARAIEASERAEERQQQGREDRRQQAQERAELRERQQAEKEELREVQRELERAHANLRRASRGVAEVHRSLNRNRTVATRAPSFGANPAVIGVVLGSNTSDGVQVIGITPDGPAERAGLEQGDVIVSMMDEPLIVAGGDGDGRLVISEVMKAVEPGDELVLVIDREGERTEINVVAEERTPISWQSVTRLGAPSAPSSPSAPGSPSAPTSQVHVQSFAFPDMDPDQLSEELEVLRGELEERHIIINRTGQSIISRSGDFDADFDQEFYIELDQLSDVGDAAIAGTSIWFGMPLTRGLKLAELDPQLGAYFDTEDGVLVLQAREDNVLQLQSGDVIVSVDGDSVRSPADVMRALRRMDAGETLVLEIMRQQSPETLTIDIPETRLGMLFDGDGTDFSHFRWNDNAGQTLERHFDSLFVPEDNDDD